MSPFLFLRQDPYQTVILKLLLQAVVLTGAKSAMLLIMTIFFVLIFVFLQVFGAHVRCESDLLDRVCRDKLRHIFRVLVLRHKVHSPTLVLQGFLVLETQRDTV